MKKINKIISALEENRLDKVLKKELVVELVNIIFSKSYKNYEELINHVEIYKYYKIGVLKKSIIKACESENTHDFKSNIYKIIQWYYEDYLKTNIPLDLYNHIKNYVNEEIKIYGYDDFIEDGWNNREIIMGMMNISLKTIPGMDDEMIGEIGDWEKIMVSAKKCLSCMVINGKMISQIFITPLSEKDFKLALKGKLNEYKIKLLGFNEPGKYKINIVTLAVLPEYRSAKTLSILMDSFFDKIVELAENKIIITDIVTTAFTSEGVVLCKMLDMKYVCEHYLDGKVYHKVFFPIDKENNFIKRHPSIVGIYEKA